jgi:hypothetical protein
LRKKHARMGHPPPQIGATKSHDAGHYPI